VPQKDLYMSMSLAGKKVLPAFVMSSWLAFITSFICSFRAITSISIICLLVAILLINRQDLRSFFRSALRNPFVVTCALFFVLQIISMVYTNDMAEGWKNVRQKSGLLFIPLTFYGVAYTWPSVRNRLLLFYCAILAAASFYCLVSAGWQYWQTGDTSWFFYHALVSPFSHHAVYFSIFVFVALVYLLEKIKNTSHFATDKTQRRKEDIPEKLTTSPPSLRSPKACRRRGRLIPIILIFYFSFFLFLLSSKLVIAFYGLYLLYYFLVLLKRNTSNRTLILVLFTLFIITGSTAFFVKNPVSDRFHEIINGDMDLITQDKFDQGDYFNGLQFRALEWRFVNEILTENRSWIAGVSPGDAQSLLNQKYISKRMYTGGINGRGRGFLGYHAHNEFLESLLHNGIIGLMVFMTIVVSLIRMIWKRKDNIARFPVLLILAYLLSESVFETQYGILIFTFFPLFLCAGLKRSAASKPRADNITKEYEQ
jgi:O-antigen ligase